MYEEEAEVYYDDEAAPVPQGRVEGTSWSCYHDDEGVPYFHCAVSGDTVWAPPAAVARALAAQYASPPVLRHEGAPEPAVAAADAGVDSDSDSDSAGSFHSADSVSD